MDFNKLEIAAACVELLDEVWLGTCSEDRIEFLHLQEDELLQYRGNLCAHVSDKLSLYKYEDIIGDPIEFALFQIHEFWRSKNGI